MIEDKRYGFRVALPGVVSARIEESDGKGPLAWRAYTSRSPGARRNAGFNAAVKVFETDSSDARTRSREPLVPNYFPALEFEALSEALAVDLVNVPARNHAGTEGRFA